MALGDPFQLLVVLGLVLLIPAIVIYWIVRLAIRHELKRRPVSNRKMMLN